MKEILNFLADLTSYRKNKIVKLNRKEKIFYKLLILSDINDKRSYRLVGYSFCVSGINLNRRKGSGFLAAIMYKEGLCTIQA